MPEHKHHYSLSTEGRTPTTDHRGFSLLEIMIVLMIIGITFSVVRLSFSDVDYDKQLLKKAQRFQVVFDMAADYAVMNQLEMGLRVEPEKNLYYFMFLNEQDRWRPINVDPIFEQHELEEDFFLELALDDLPWVSEDSLLSDSLFDEELSVSEESTNIGNEEEEEPEPPQVFIFSSGEFTPFSVSFKFEPQFGDAQPIYYRVNGVDFTPLQLEGPLDFL